jgi:tripartite-type tricarboxylate transporter receptor subunit TctC
LKKLVVGIVLFALLITLIAGCSGGVAKPSDYPTKSIDLVCHYGPGGIFDLQARGTAQYLSKYVGQPVVVKNMPGGNRAIGTMAVYSGKPDGYTLGILDTEALVANQIALTPPPDYDVLKFQLLSNPYNNFYCVAVAASSPYKTIDDLKKAGQAKPIKVGCVDVGTTEAISMEVLGIPHTFVPGYEGLAQAVTGIVRGDADCVTLSDVGILPWASDLRVLMQMGDVKSIAFPQAPTSKELGYDALNVLFGPFWYVAPPGTPDNIVAFLRDSFSKTLKDADFQAWAAKNKYVFTDNSIDKSLKDAAQLKALYTKYGDLLKKYLG